jgi:hypothetical protein
MFIILFKFSAVKVAARLAQCPRASPSERKKSPKINVLDGNKRG